MSDDSEASDSGEHEEQHQLMGLQPSDLTIPDESRRGRKRKSDAVSSFSVSMRTVLRWKGKEGVNVEHILGCSDSSPLEERGRCEEVLKATGQLICILCNVSVPANKKSIKRHQTKNKKHLARLAEIGQNAPEIGIAKVAAAPPYAVEGWEIIKNSGKLTNVGGLKKLVEDLGVFSPKDLTYCSNEELEEISMYLKKVPQRAFLKLFKIDKKGFPEQQI
jgi:hypothetical protein